ncbi:MAG TPA: hypothetical protein VJ747_01975, partial [Stellaceae bacterium]|nr:hypothetical protein [Stellaceae bacterium]
MQQHAPWIGAALASLLATAAFAATVPAPAVQNPQRHRTEATGQDIAKLGGAEGWDAFSDTVKGHKICYLIGKPTKSEPANAKRGPIYASVTHRPSEKRTNEVSFTVGYLFKEG